jgi:hypothetical protein
MKKLFNVFVLCAFFMALMSPVAAKAKSEPVKELVKQKDIESDVVLISFEFGTKLFYKVTDFVYEKYFFVPDKVINFQNFISFKKKKDLNYLYHEVLDDNSIFKNGDNFVLNYRN